MLRANIEKTIGFQREKKWIFDKKIKLWNNTYMQDNSIDIRAKTIEKILRTYTSLFWLSETDTAITRKNLETMEDSWIAKEIDIIENFSRNMDVLSRKILQTAIQEDENEEKQLLQDHQNLILNF